MLKKLIVIEDDRQEQFDTFEEMVKSLIHPNYYEMTPEEKENVLKLKSAQNTIELQQNNMIIQDEITYILSLVALNKITLLEQKDANILTTCLDKTNMKHNYIEVNFFAEELMRNHLNEIVGK